MRRVGSSYIKFAVAEKPPRNDIGAVYHGELRSGNSQSLWGVSDRSTTQIVRVPPPAISKEDGPTSGRPIFYNGLHLYNKLDDDIKYKNPKILSKYLNKNISYMYPSDNILRYDHG